MRVRWLPRVVWNAFRVNDHCGTQFSFQKVRIKKFGSFSGNTRALWVNHKEWKPERVREYALIMSSNEYKTWSTPGKWWVLYNFSAKRCRKIIIRISWSTRKKQCKLIHKNWSFLFDVLQPEILAYGWSSSLGVRIVDFKALQHKRLGNYHSSLILAPQ